MSQPLIMILAREIKQKLRCKFSEGFFCLTLYIDEFQGRVGVMIFCSLICFKGVATVELFSWVSLPSINNRGTRAAHTHFCVGGHVSPV